VPIALVISHGSLMYRPALACYVLGNGSRDEKVWQVDVVLHSCITCMINSQLGLPVEDYYINQKLNDVSFHESKASYVM
jgi:hypothetical protein